MFTSLFPFCPSLRSPAGKACLRERCWRVGDCHLATVSLRKARKGFHLRGSRDTGLAFLVAIKVLALTPVGAAGWSFRGPLAPLSLPHTKSPVASPPESHSDKQTPSQCSFSSIFPPPAVSPESDRHNRGPRQPQGSWRAELSSC